MAKPAPYLDGDKWTLDVDPDDEVNYAFDVTKWLADSNTEAESFEIISEGVTVLVKGIPQGERSGLLPAKMKVTFAEGTTPHATARVSTIDDQQFDKTMWFKQVEN